MEQNTKQDIKRRSGGLIEVLRAEGEEAPSRVIRGQAIVFDSPTELYRDDEMIIRESIAKEAVTDELLSGSDILMTIDHDPGRLLARSKKGAGSLKYTLTDEGVEFEFEAPKTPDGETALELVRKQIIDGCSFWAEVYADDIDSVRSEEDGYHVVTRTIKRIAALHDFTITARPAYEQTSVEAVARALKDEDAKALAEAEQAKADKAKAEEDMRRSWAEVAALIKKH